MKKSLLVFSLIRMRSKQRGVIVKLCVLKIMYYRVHCK